jgi:hypothetical protein
MPTSQITCPHCHTPISLDDALTGQIKNTLEQKFTVEYEQRLSKERKSLEIKLKEEFTKVSATELTFLKEQLETEKKKREETEKQELALRKREAELEDKERGRELELQRQMDEERKKIRETTETAILEQQKQKNLEKDKVIADLQKSVEDLSRKANQGSQQTQGEVRELELETTLRDLFRDDVIEPIGKGVNGADVRQIVRTNRGTVCGTILWESKQTKTWSEGWLAKLKMDLRAENANIPILITSAYNDPRWSGQTHRDGVWICSPQNYITLALALRKSLIDSARERAMAQRSGEKADLVYTYVTSSTFRQQVESLVEVYTEIQNQVDKERAAMERIWKAREGQAQRLMLSMGNIYGSIQGLAGATVVPELPGLDLIGLDAG